MHSRYSYSLLRNNIIVIQHLFHPIEPTLHILSLEKGKFKFRFGNVPKFIWPRVVGAGVEDFKVMVRGLQRGANWGRLRGRQWRMGVLQMGLRRVTEGRG